MAGTYSITEVKEHPVKFACMVSFNGKAAEYYEVDSTDAQVVADTLQTTADADADRIANLATVEAEKSTIEVVDGKVVIK